MGNIIKGGEISVYKTTAITMAVAKKENRNGVKAKFLILTAKDEESPLAKPSRIPMFEEDLGEDIFQTLAAYRLNGTDGKPVQDAKGGYPIDLKALKAAMKNDEELNDQLEGFMRLNGGMTMDYKLKKGPCYANDIDGKRTKDGRGNDVVKDTISVFVQVKNFLPTENGGMQPVFFAGMGLEERGSRMEAQFYREAVMKAQVAETPAETANGSTDPF